jgi:hypothetical protein
VTLVDCTDVSRTGGSVKDRVTNANHQYYRKRAEVITDVHQVLAGITPGQMPSRDCIAARFCFHIRPAKR